MQIKIPDHYSISRQESKYILSFIVWDPINITHMLARASEIEKCPCRLFFTKRAMFLRVVI